MRDENKPSTQTVAERRKAIDCTMYLANKIERRRPRTRTDAIKAELTAKYPEPLNDENRLLYYTEAAECYGQRSERLECENASLRWERDEDKKEQLRLIDVCKAMQRDKNNFFEQSCINLKRAEQAERQLEETRNTLSAALFQLDEAERQRGEARFALHYITGQTHLQHIHDTASAALAKLNGGENG